jgi:hypothetical protein
VVRFLVVALVGLAVFGSLAGCELLRESAGAGFRDGFSEAPMNPPSQGDNAFTTYGLQYLLYLLAYGTGSLGKGWWRQKFGNGVKPEPPV